MDINAIKARLGSIAPSMMDTLPPKVQQLLKEDIPALIKLVKELDEEIEYQGREGQ